MENPASGGAPIGQAGRLDSSDYTRTTQTPQQLARLRGLRALADDEGPLIDHSDEIKRLANLAALDVSEEDEARFRKHRPPPAKMGCQNRRKPPFRGYLALSGSDVPETEDGAVCEMRRHGGA